MSDGEKIDLEFIKKINKLRKKRTEKISIYKRELDEEIFAFCQENGGHFFNKWTSNYVEYLSGYRKEFSRICWYCHCVEYKKEEVEDERE